MNLEEVKEKLLYLKRVNLAVANEGLESYTKIYKNINAQLYDIIEFLLDEIERIKTPPIAVLEQSFEDLVPRISLPPIGSPPFSPPDEPIGDYPPHKSPPVCDPIRKHRKDQNNAGDAT